MSHITEQTPEASCMEALQKAGRIIMENGGETYRAEETVNRMGTGFGLENVESFAVPSGLFISYQGEDGNPVTSVKRVHRLGRNLTRVDEVNQVSRKVFTGEMNCQAALAKLREIDAIRGLEDLQFRKPITFFVGENGSGKSTLLEAIAIAYGFNPEGGTRNYHFSTRDTHSELCDAIRLIRNPSRPGWGYFLRAESFYNVATAEEGYAEVSRDYHRKSHWESFLAVAQDNFSGNGIAYGGDRDPSPKMQSVRYNYRMMILQNSMTRCVVILFRPKAADFAALDDRLGEAIRLLFAEMKIPESKAEEYLAKAGKCVITKSGSRKEIGRLVQVIKDLEYCLNVEEYFRMDTLYPTHISMWCCNGILWMTEDKRVVTATDSMREVFGLGKYEGSWSL